MLACWHVASVTGKIKKVVRREGKYVYEVVIQELSKSREITDIIPIFSSFSLVISGMVQEPYLETFLLVLIPT